MNWKGIFALLLILFTFITIVIAPKENNSRVTTTWEDPPKAFSFSNSVSKQSDSAIPTKEELEAYRELEGLNG